MNAMILTQEQAKEMPQPYQVDFFDAFMQSYRDTTESDCHGDMVEFLELRGVNYTVHGDAWGFDSEEYYDAVRRMYRDSYYDYLTELFKQIRHNVKEEIFS